MTTNINTHFNNIHLNDDHETGDNSSSDLLDFNQMINTPSKRRKSPPPALNFSNIHHHTAHHNLINDDQIKHEEPIDSCMPHIFTFKTGNNNNNNNNNNKSTTSEEDWVDSILTKSNNPHQFNLNDLNELDEFDQLYKNSNQVSSPTIPMDSPSELIDNDMNINLINNKPTTTTTTITPSNTTTISPSNTTTTNTSTKQRNSIKISLSPIIAVNHNDRLKVYELIKLGLESYIKQLQTPIVQDTLKPRVDFLIDFIIQHSGTNYRPKFIFDYLSYLKTDSKFQILKSDFNDNQNLFLMELRSVYNESERARKAYNHLKKKNINMANTTTTTNVSEDSMVLDLSLQSNDHHNMITPNHTPNGPINFNNNINPNPPTQIHIPLPQNQTVNQTSQEVSMISIEKLKISFQSINNNNPQILFDITNLPKLQLLKKDFQYLSYLNSNLLEILNQFNYVVSNNTNLLHTLVPLNFLDSLNYQLNLEKGRFISFTEIIIDSPTSNPNSHDFSLSSPLDTFIPTNNGGNTNSEFSNLVYFKINSKLYRSGKLLYNLSESITGYYTDSSRLKIKVNLPLNYKFWAGITNEFQNGLMNPTSCNDLIMIHSIYLDSSSTSSSSSSNKPLAASSIPLYCFVWDFQDIETYYHNTNNGQQNISIFIPKKQTQRKLARSNSLMNQNQNQNHTANVNLTSGMNQPLQNKLLIPVRGHKRTRSKSLTGLDDLMHHSNMIYNTASTNTTTKMNNTITSSSGNTSSNTSSSTIDNSFNDSFFHLNNHSTGTITSFESSLDSLSPNQGNQVKVPVSASNVYSAPPSQVNFYFNDQQQQQQQQHHQLITPQKQVSMATSTPITNHLTKIAEKQQGRQVVEQQPSQQQYHQFTLPLQPSRRNSRLNSSSTVSTQQFDDLTPPSTLMHTIPLSRPRSSSNATTPTTMSTPAQKDGIVNYQAIRHISLTNSDFPSSKQTQPSMSMSMTSTNHHISNYQQSHHHHNNNNLITTQVSPSNSGSGSSISPNYYKLDSDFKINFYNGEN